MKENENHKNGPFVQFKRKAVPVSQINEIVTEVIELLANKGCSYDEAQHILSEVQDVIGEHAELKAPTE